MSFNCNNNGIKMKRHNYLIYSQGDVWYNHFTGDIYKNLLHWLLTQQKTLKSDRKSTTHYKSHHIHLLISC